jgi:hypothetical protein
LEKKHAGAARFFDIDDRLKRLSDLGDQLETFRSAVDFELWLELKPRYARNDAAGQQCEVENPLACRACVRPTKARMGMYVISGSPEQRPRSEWVMLV